MQTNDGRTSLHISCFVSFFVRCDEYRAALVKLLLQFGADSTLTDAFSDLLRERHPLNYATIALLEKAPDAEITSFLVKARRLVVADSNASLPTYLQAV